MRRLDEFRLFYNHTIHPELLRLEKQRRRLLRLLFFSILILGGLLILQFFLKTLALSLFLFIPIGIYISWLIYRVRDFVKKFKPRVVNLILDFLDDGPNYGTMSYDQDKYIDKKTFLDSLIFSSNAPFYSGEDYIKGKIGELDFEMSELFVQDYSRVKNRLNEVFRGVFLHASFHKPMRGSVVIIPDQYIQFLSRSIKAFHKKGGRPVLDGTFRREFEDIFAIWATSDANTGKLLSDEMQKAILRYRDRTQKDIYLSVVRRDIYIGVSEPKDILEPFIFKSNVSFELVREFYEDIALLISIVEDFDAKN